MRPDLYLDSCLVKNDCIRRLNVKCNGLFYCSGLLLASVSTASNYSMKNSRLEAVYRCDSTADEAELSPVSGPWRQKLLTSADQDIRGASEYICNLKSARTKSLSPLVMDLKWADQPQIWGPHAEGVQPSERWIADKKLMTPWSRLSWVDGGRTLDEKRTVGNQWIPGSQIYIIASLVLLRWWSAVKMSYNTVLNNTWTP